MNRFIPTTALHFIFASLLLLTHAQAADKNDYTLLKPTPRDEMRSLSSDAADKVVGPFTVDAGHFQIEADALNFATDEQTQDFGSIPVRLKIATDQYLWAPTVKVGLCNRVDLEVQFSYRRLTQEDTVLSPPIVSGLTIKTHSNDWGAVQPAFKINLWGNDGGSTALSIVPFVSIPTETDFDVTGGVILPFAWKLPENFSIKVAPQLFFFESGANKTLYAGFAGATAINKSLLDSRLDVFASFNSQVTGQSSRPWIGYAGIGAAYNFTPNFQVYVGNRFGVTSSAYDYNPYIGITWRY